MSYSNLSKSSSRIFFALIAVAALALVSVPAMAEVSCEEAASWAEANRDNLPQTLADFAKVEKDYRAAAFKALTTEKQTRIWNDHLALLVEEHDDLTDDQVKEILGASDLFENPEAYAEKTREGMIAVALGSFATRISGDTMEQDYSAYQQVQLQDCNCIRNYDPGCRSVFCLPNQNCSPFACNGLY